VCYVTNNLCHCTHRVSVYTHNSVCVWCLSCIHHWARCICVVMSCATVVLSCFQYRKYHVWHVRWARCLVVYFVVLCGLLCYLFGAVVTLFPISLTCACESVWIDTVCHMYSGRYGLCSYSINSQYHFSQNSIEQICWTSLQSYQNLRGPHVTQKQQLSIDVCCLCQTSAASPLAVDRMMDKWTLECFVMITTHSANRLCRTKSLSYVVSRKSLSSAAESKSTAASATVIVIIIVHLQ